MSSRKPKGDRRKDDDGPLHHQPFRRLGRLAHVRDTPKPATPTRPPTPEPTAPAPSEEELFAREMAGVRPLAIDTRSPAPRPRAQPPRQIATPDAEALAELSDLVTGVGPFDLTHTDEYLEGAVVGLDPRLVRQLRKGQFVAQSHLDLHGLVTADARLAVDQFLERAHRHGHRCVLIIHGRGLNSVDQRPVLKKHLAQWLSRGAHARLVLAFTSARPCDGGAGAVYVLLRRQRAAKHPLRVTNGSPS